MTPITVVNVALNVREEKCAIAESANLDVQPPKSLAMGHVLIPITILTIVVQQAIVREAMLVRLVKHPVNMSISERVLIKHANSAVKMVIILTQTKQHVLNAQQTHIAQATITGTSV